MILGRALAFSMILAAMLMSCTKLDQDGTIAHDTLDDTTNAANSTAATAIVAAPAAATNSFAATNDKPVAPPAAVQTIHWPGFAIIKAEPADKGILPLQAVARRQVTLANRSDQTLRLEPAGVSCSCLKLTIEQERIQPGETANVILSSKVFPLSGRQVHEARLWVLPADLEGTAAEIAAEKDIDPFPLRISWTPDLAYEIHPTQVLLGEVGGVAFAREVFVNWFAPKEGGMIADITSDVDWLQISEPQPVHPGVVKVKVRGVLPYAPLPRQGNIIFNMHSLRHPTSAVPIIVRTLPPLRPEPAGVRALLENDTIATQTVKLIPQRMPAPEAVRWESEQELPAGVKIELAPDGSTLAVSLDPSQLAEPAGGIYVQLLAADGELLAQVPVSWLSLAP